MSVALWCLLIAGILPIVSAGVAKVLGSGGDIAKVDNNHPRAWLARLEGRAARAHAAQLNAFEAFPFFAAAVLLAEIQDAPSTLVGVLAVMFLAARIAYLWAYVEDRATLRSILWAVGFVSCIAIFLSALLARA